MYDYYIENIDRETVLIPLIYTYDSIFISVANVFNPIDGLEYEQQEKLEDDGKEKFYINIQRY